MRPMRALSHVRLVQAANPLVTPSLTPSTAPPPPTLDYTMMLGHITALVWHGVYKYAYLDCLQVN